tara:strand:+ start:10074 stop:10493 length:420 start_codon:yes stop_codon:yes gene_type:complete
MKPWDIIDAITYTKEDLDFDDPEVEKMYFPYKINKWLSTVNDAFIEVLNEINGIEMTKAQHYDFLKNVLPKCKVTVNWQLFKNIENIDEERIKKEIRYIAVYHEVGLRDAEMYHEMLTSEEIEKIIDSFRYGQNEIVEV